PRCHGRLSTAALPALLTAVKGSDLPLTLEPSAATRLFRLVRRYDMYLVALSSRLVIPLPSLIQPRVANRKKGV
ncbi:MAG TPA: hypothetical protein VN648_28115, partial [Candidatus Methylomirabilis sp.]|nr:hypothetical protein [Candidatus Methylomirabilis sp.]